jgi:site-specific DNA-methyltransferase (adenine-specific)
MNVTDKIVITCEDNMELMARYPDKHFELAIVDPPYGISYARGKNGWGVNDNRPTLENVKWDKETPSLEYFNELIRVSKEQIIWGGNYFTDKIPVSKCWIIWNKINNTENKSVFADGELAWTSFKKVVKMFTLRTMGFISDTKDNNRIHPTQKPTELYKWLLDNYAKQGDKILDTHLGSGSIAIACHDYGFELTACELDKKYYDKAMKRIKNHTNQQKLF